VCFLDANLGFVSGPNSSMFMTTDGGQTWINQNSTLNTRGIVRAIPPSNAVAMSFYKNLATYSCSSFIQKTEDNTRCDAGQLLLSATASYGLPSWYDSPVATVPLFVGSNFTTPHLLESKEYWVETDSLGCVSHRRRVMANIILENNTVVQSSDSLVCMAVGVSYQWLNCDTEQIIAGETAKKYAPTTNGNYAVIITNSSCADTSDCFNANNIGLADYEKSVFSIRPNPVNDKVTISTTDEIQEISIYDTTGKCLLKMNAGENQKTIIIDLSSFKPGLFVVNIKTENNFHSELLLKNP
jgi:hypothetical protein